MLPRMHRMICRFSTNYYQLLGVPQSATFEQIQEAYNKRAKEFFPEVSSGPQHPLSAEQGRRFQELAEAYAVLSVQESRYNYDTLQKTQPDLVYAQAREALRTIEQKKEDGSKGKPGYQAGTWAEERRRWLAEERTRFNVDQNGRYRGGLPQKDQLNIRGSALGIPGKYHEPLVHNLKINPMENEQFVDGVTAQRFKVWAMGEQAGKMQPYLWQVAEVDYKFWRFETVRTAWRWGRNIALILLAFPFFYTLYERTATRNLVRQLSDYVRNGQSVEGQLLANGLEVHVSETGALVLREKKRGGGHH